MVQEVFCRLVQRSDLPDRTSAWLFQVAANLVREEARKAKRRQAREVASARAELTWPDPNEGVVHAELRAAVQALPTEERDAVILRVWGGLTLVEAGKLMNMSVATVHRRYETALKKLTAQWNPHAIETTPCGGSRSNEP